MIYEVKKYCTDNKLCYTFGVLLQDSVVFCVANVYNLTYTMYKLSDGVVSLYLDNLSLLQTRFQKETLLGMGGELIEKL